MALKNQVVKKKHEGFYVAVRRDTGMPWLLSAEHYMAYGEEFERGTFYRTFKEAAKAEEEARMSDPDDEQDEAMSPETKGKKVEGKDFEKKSGNNSKQE